MAVISTNMAENSSKNKEDSEKTAKESEESKIASNTDEQLQSNELEDKWLIRDCEIYKDEYKECTGFRARFHQYFIYGETLDCNQWKKDYTNCCKWTEDGDVKAAEAVIKSERIRRLKRLRAHYQNDTWTKREAPPADWDAPLPEWMVKRDENTYLAYKAKEMREGKDKESDKSFCAIM